MGALLVTNPEIDHLLEKHTEVRDCVYCSNGLMVPATMDYEKVYKGTTLIIKNLPVFKCQNNECNEITFGTGSLLKAVKKAKERFDDSGIPTFQYRG